jgi:hypothetical protein
MWIILINKPLPPNTALNLKVDKVADKGLSTEDYSTGEDKISRFSGINTGDQDLSTYATNANLAKSKIVIHPLWDRCWNY